MKRNTAFAGNWDAWVLAGAFGLSLSLYAGCGSGTDGHLLGETDFTVIQDDGLSLSSDSIQGSGTILATSPLAAVNSEAGYRFTFRLADGGRLTLLSHADDQAAGGVEIRFTRDGSTVSYRLSEHGKSKVDDGDLTAEAGAASGEISVLVDVHNAEANGHVLMWPGSEADPDEDGATMNHEGTSSEPAKGTGTFWGFVLKDATLQSATTGDAHSEE